jgi:hypothetical protein
MGSRFPKMGVPLNHPIPTFVETSISSHIIDPHFRGIIGRYQPQLAEYHCWRSIPGSLINYKGCKTMLNPSYLYMFDGKFHRGQQQFELDIWHFPNGIDDVRWLLFLLYATVKRFRPMSCIDTWFRYIMLCDVTWLIQNVVCTYYTFNSCTCRHVEIHYSSNGALGRCVWDPPTATWRGPLGFVFEPPRFAHVGHMITAWFL